MSPKITKTFKNLLCCSQTNLEKLNRKKAKALEIPKYYLHITCAFCQNPVPFNLPPNTHGFLCVKCGHLNRIVDNGLGSKISTTHLDRETSLSDSFCKYTSKYRSLDNIPANVFDFTNTNESNNNNSQSYSIESLEPPTINSCSICMEKPADIILLPCEHSGLCEDCARHIYLNLAVGGSKCPRCREDICEIAKIVKVFSLPVIADDKDICSQYVTPVSIQTVTIDTSFLKRSQSAPTVPPCEKKPKQQESENVFIKDEEIVRSDDLTTVDE